jgi:K(+)-stimulated pyrophosphate-energized sodium pump
MNILIKLMSIVSLVIAPHIAERGGERGMAPVQPEATKQEWSIKPKVRYAEVVAPEAARIIFTALRQVE